MEKYMKREIFTGTNRQTGNKSCLVCSGILQSSLLCPTVTTLYEYLKGIRSDFSAGFRSGISNADKMSDIPLSVLENMSKKNMESFILS